MLDIAKYQPSLEDMVADIENFKIETANIPSMEGIGDKIKWLLKKIQEFLIRVVDFVKDIYFSATAKFRKMSDNFKRYMNDRKDNVDLPATLNLTVEMYGDPEKMFEELYRRECFLGQKIFQLLETYNTVFSKIFYAVENMDSTGKNTREIILNDTKKLSEDLKRRFTEEDRHTSTYRDNRVGYGFVMLKAPIINKMVTIDIGQHENNTYPQYNFKIETIDNEAIAASTIVVNNNRYKFFANDAYKICEEAVKDCSRVSGRNESYKHWIVQKLQRKANEIMNSPDTDTMSFDDFNDLSTFIHEFFNSYRQLSQIAIQITNHYLNIMNYILSKNWSLTAPKQ